MEGLLIDGGVRFCRDLPEPEPVPGEALVRVILAGICSTDLELVQGYMGFSGIPGHEFVGRLVAPAAGLAEGTLVVGEINAGCGRCQLCSAGFQRHCAQRTVLGILGRGGSHAQFLSLPVANLHEVPASIPSQLAVFTEPLAAAYEVTEQRPAAAGERWLVLGDGRLGLLVSAVLLSEGFEPVVCGKHERKLALARKWGVETIAPEGAEQGGRSWDVVVEATGSPAGLAAALALVRPRGTVVLKTTVQAPINFAAAQVVIDEITILGSRCGPFDRALAGIEQFVSAGIDLQDLIDEELPLWQGVAAYALAATRGSLKVLLWA